MLSDNTLFFLHIPKAGGNSFVKHLSTWFATDQVIKTPINEEFINELDLIFDSKILYGHQHYPFVNIFNTKPIIVTFFREPVDRVISAYEYVQRKKSHILHEAFREKIHGIKDFITDDEFSFHSSNMQTRMFGIDFDMKGFINNYLNKKWSATETKKKILEELSIACNDKIYYKAKKRISKLPFFGITEKFEDSLSFFCNTFSCPLPKTLYVENSASETQKKMRSKAYTLEEIDIIKENNQYDAKLYTFVSKLFKEKIETTKSLTV